MCTVIGDAVLQSHFLPKNRNGCLTHTHTHTTLCSSTYYSALFYNLCFISVTSAVYLHRQTLIWTNADNLWALGLPWWLGSTMYETQCQSLQNSSMAAVKGGGEYSWVSSANYPWPSSFFSLRNIKKGFKKILFFSHIHPLQYVPTVTLVYIPIYNLLNHRTSFCFPSLLLLRP